MISLAEATHQLLEQRSANSEVGSSPQPYDILSDFHLMRSNFKAAAAAQYELAMRLRQEGRHLPDALARIANALGKSMLHDTFLSDNRLKFKAGSYVCTCATMVHFLMLIGASRLFRKVMESFVLHYRLAPKVLML